MDKPLACIEISSTGVRLLIGYEISGQPVVLYSKEENGDFINPDGTIKDADALIAALSKFHEIHDENAKWNINVKEVCLILPSCGLNVFTSKKTSTVVSASYTVDRIDINNVLAQVHKELPPQGNEVVDIIPDLFILDQGQTEKEPPIGKHSSSLSIDARVFVLPRSIANGYKTAVERAGYRIKQSAVAAYCYAELFRTYPEVPENYVLIDIGSRITTASVIGHHSPYGAINFSRGSESLTIKIAKSLNLSMDEARKLKETYGYDERRISYNPPIYIQKGGENPITVTQADLNAAISEWVDEYHIYLEQAIERALHNVGNGKESLPLLITGGGAKCYGLLHLLERYFPSRVIRPIGPKSVGARENKWGPLLGLIMASSRYRGSLEDAGGNGVKSLSREEDGKNKKKGLFSRDNRDEDEI